MILSAGLTPAWQQILVFDSFRPGEVNRAAKVHWCASGKVLNSGIAVHHLGGKSLTLATLGGPPLGQLRDELRTLGVPLRIVETAAATRICTTIIDRCAGTITELVENGRPLADGELADFSAAYQAAARDAQVVVLIGTLPQDTPHTYYRRLLETSSAPAVLDFRGEGLLAVLDLEPRVVKPNRDELAQTLGRDLRTDDSLVEAMRSLNERGAQWVTVTDGPRAVWLTSRNDTYRFQPPAVPPAEIANPIGCGDAMAGALAWAIRDGQTMPEAVRLGIAASIDNLRHLLPCRLSPERVRRIAGEVAIHAM